MDDFFATDAGFFTYVGSLALSAALLLVLAVLGLGNRIVNGLIGLAAGGYAAYLIATVWVDGGEYQLFIYAFILPFFAIFQIVKGLKERNAAAEAPAQAVVQE